MSVVIVHDEAALAAYLPAWDALAAAAIEPNPFYESWMLLPALHSFATGQAIQFVLIFTPDPERPHAAPLLCGFFPLQPHRLYKGLPVPNVRLWQHRHCFSCTPLLRTEFARECLLAFFNWLAAGSRCGVLLEMPLISGDGPFHQVLTDVLNQRGNVFSVLQTFTRALFRPRENGDAYLQAALSGDYRKKLRRWKRRLSEMGKLDFVALEDGDDPAAWAEKFLQVEASGWKGKAGTALASNEADREFFVQSVATAHRRGRLDLTFLRLDGRTLAAQCCFLARPGAFAFKIAFNEDYAKCAPGILLAAELIQRFHTRPGIRWMDSCAEADSFLNSLWIDRKTMQTIAVATGKWSGDFVVSALPVLRWIKRKLSHKAAHAGRPAPA